MSIFKFPSEREKLFSMRGIVEHVVTFGREKRKENVDCTDGAATRERFGRRSSNSLGLNHFDSPVSPVTLGGCNLSPAAIYTHKCL